MTPFNRTGQMRLDRHLSFVGRGTIPAALFDLGIYPAAVPAPDSRVTGEVYELTDPFAALRGRAPQRRCRQKKYHIASLSATHS